ncbi:MAG: tetratricopeptide repeat protein [Candidatus Kapabacteria bacterium]|nr:tetratricopeptide repeat protein [Ignavibacteriota bacterium]MCW5885967.1 tetratricopeptide repeat protein [Candidatus Kapabacteria bacterium]
MNLLNKYKISRFSNRDYLLLIMLPAFVILITSGCSSGPKEVKTESFRQLSNTGFDINEYDAKKRQDFARRHMTDASKYKQQGRYSDAIIEYQEAIRWDKMASIYFAIAESYWALDKPFSAVENCYKSIEMDSTFLPVYELLFNIYSSMRMSKEAYIVTEQILKFDPSRENQIRFAIMKAVESPSESTKMLENLLRDSSDTELMLILSSAYEQNQEFDKMAVLLERLHKDQPSNFELASGLIEYYSDKGDLENSFRILGESEKFFSPSEIVQIYNNIGINLLSLDAEEQSSTIKKYISNIDERFYFDWVTQSVAGKLSANIQDSIASDKFYSRALTLNDTNAFLQLDAAISYSILKNNKKSIELLKKGIEKFPDDVRFIFYLSNTYMIEKEYETARNYGKKAYESDSSNVIFISIYASILQELGEYEESDRLYEKSLGIDPGDANTNNNYAYSLAVRGIKLNRALKYSQLSLELEPDNAAYLDTYGWIHYQIGNYDTALEYIKKAIDTGDVSAEVFEHLGDIYIKMNKKELALEAYNKSLELDSDSKEVISKINELTN